MKGHYPKTVPVRRKVPVRKTDPGPMKGPDPTRVLAPKTAPGPKTGPGLTKGRHLTIRHRHLMIGPHRTTGHPLTIDHPRTAHPRTAHRRTAHRRTDPRKIGRSIRPMTHPPTSRTNPMIPTIQRKRMSCLRAGRRNEAQIRPAGIQPIRRALHTAANYDPSPAECNSPSHQASYRP